MKPICYIVGAMEPGEIAISSRRPALVIAADAGVEHLQRQGITPDWIVGDFDSLGYVPQGGNIVRHPVEKDDTDMLLAVRTGMAHGCREFVLYGGVGGRLDHTYANLQTLVWMAEQGLAGCMVCGDMLAAVIQNGSMTFPAGMAGTVSVFCPDGKAQGVCLRGLYYPLEGAELTGSFPLGVSNSFTGAAAEISVESGRLLVMWQESIADYLQRC